MMMVPAPLFKDQVILMDIEHTHYYQTSLRSDSAWSAKEGAYQTH
jgi:hypothetical protein